MLCEFCFHENCEAKQILYLVPYHRCACKGKATSTYILSPDKDRQSILSDIALDTPKASCFTSQFAPTVDIADSKRSHLEQLEIQSELDRL